MSPWDYYVALFAGRDDVYSVWYGDGWAATRKPLTGKLVLAAFETKIPISAYLLMPDSTTHVACIDIDRADGFALGKLLARRVNELGGVGYLEKSVRGCHFWLFLDERVPAIQLRRALRALVNESGIPKCPGGGKCPTCTPPKNASANWKPPTEAHDDPRVELRPSTDHLPEPTEDVPQPLDKCIRMPTMPHHRTGDRFVLLRTDGTKLPGKISEMLLEIDTCPVGMIADLAERAPLPKMSPTPRGFQNPYGDPSVVESASQILQAVAPWAQPGKVGKCPFHDDRRPSLSILRDDQRAICHATGSGCPADNNGRGRGTHELKVLVNRLTGSTR